MEKSGQLAGLAAVAAHVLAVTDADPDSRDVPWLLDHAAIYLHTRGEPRPARPLCERAHQLYRDLLGEDHPDTLASTNTLARVLRALFEYERARALDEDTLTRYRRLLGEDHPDTLRAANSLAFDLTNLGEHERARALEEDTLTRRRRVLGEDHPYTLVSANNLALVLSALGEHQRARDLLEDALVRYRRMLGEDHPDTLASVNNLALVLTNLGEHEQARALRLIQNSGTGPRPPHWPAGTPVFDHVLKEFCILERGPNRNTGHDLNFPARHSP